MSTNRVTKTSVVQKTCVPSAFSLKYKIVLQLLPRLDIVKLKQQKDSCVNIHDSQKKRLVVTVHFDICLLQPLHSKNALLEGRLLLKS